MKPIRFLVPFLSTFLLSSCSELVGIVLCPIFELENCNITEVERFHPSLSSISLARFLTFTDTQATDEMILNKYPYEAASFWYVVDNKCTINDNESVRCEKILLSISYSNTTFEEVINFIKQRKGFNENINWSYSHFACYLNTEDYYNHWRDGSYKEDDLIHQDALTDVSLENDIKRIHWINFVAISEETLTINFVGLYYSNHDGGYLFTEWSEVFNEFFSFYDWGAE